MTHRKRAPLRLALTAVLCHTLAYGSQPNGLTQASQTATSIAAADTALHPATRPDTGQHFTAAPQLALNRQAHQFVHQYLSENEYALQKIKKRSTPYFRIMEMVLKKHRLPLQLKYLAVTESGLNAGRTSKKGAAGPWQLMPHTAIELGLKVDSLTDERTHYTKSTTAAARYLKHLHSLFDDWLLTVAAYNGGPGTVYKAIRKSGSRNFWQLQHHLPAETRQHVKRFIGIHYFFEAEGSELVFTKGEWMQYQNELLAYHQWKAAQEDTLMQATAETAAKTVSVKEQ